MKPAREPQRFTDARSTRIASISADGEDITLLDGSSWRIAGLTSYISRHWKAGDEVVTAFDEIHHLRSNARVAARTIAEPSEPTA